MNARVIVTSVCVLVAATLAQAAPDRVIEIGNRRELFVDDFLVQELAGARLRLHQPVPREVSFIFDKPWEGNESYYITVLEDDLVTGAGRYRMYYRGRNVLYDQKGLHLTHPEVVCYAESADGISWRRRELRLHEFEGNKRNNILWKGVGVHNFSPFIDGHPNCPPSQRYKAVGHGPGGLYAFQSADGIHWSKMQEEPVITKGAFDSHNVVFWDAMRGQYREYHRDFRNGRDIRTSASGDFLKWGESTFLDYAPPVQTSEDSPQDGTEQHPAGRVSQLYTNNVTPYYRAPHIFLGFPTRYIDRGWNPTTRTLPNPKFRELRGAVSKREGSALTDGMLMSSRDGSTFRVWPESFIRPGLRQKDNWFYGDNYQNWGLVETRGAYADSPRELSIYVTESALQGTSVTIRRHTIRIDGFVSVEAPLAGGYCTTKPLRFSGSRLSLNFSTSAVGTVRAELQRPDGTPIPGYTLQECTLLYGDSLAGVIQWRGGADISRLAGQPIRVRFELRDADLYSVQFTESAD